MKGIAVPSVMSKKLAAAFALLVGAPMLAGCAKLARADGAEALAADDLPQSAGSAVCSPRRAETSEQPHTF